jgi:hypothetical protein
LGDEKTGWFHDKNNNQESGRFTAVALLVWVLMQID